MVDIWRRRSNLTPDDPEQPALLMIVNPGSYFGTSR
jgi:hypothetical protein